MASVECRRPGAASRTRQARDARYPQSDGTRVPPKRDHTPSQDGLLAALALSVAAAPIRPFADISHISVDWRASTHGRRLRQGGCEEVEDGLVKLRHGTFGAMRTCAVGPAQHDVFVWCLQLLR